MESSVWPHGPWCHVAFDLQRALTSYHLVLTLRDRCACGQAFTEYDADNTGSLSRKEFANLIKSLTGQVRDLPPSPHISLYLTVSPPHHHSPHVIVPSRLLTPSVYVYVCSSGQAASHKMLTKLLRIVDDDQSGYVCIEEFLVRAVPAIMPASMSARARPCPPRKRSPLVHALRYARASVAPTRYTSRATRVLLACYSPLTSRMICARAAELRGGARRGSRQPRHCQHGEARRGDGGGAPGAP